MAAALAFFRRKLLLAHAFGIPVRVDYRWFPVLALMSVATALSLDRIAAATALSVMLAFAATGIFFATIFLHELAHALAARAEGLETVEIVLHPYGGLTRFRHEPETAQAEFRIALAGPAASFVIALVFSGLMAAANQAGMDILAVLLFLLAVANFLLAVFNLFPGYPLDGGRVLRAYLWKNGRDLDEATTLTGRCGQFIGGGLVLIGLGILILQAEYFMGVWAMLVGLFLFDSAVGIIREVRAVQRTLVDDLMELAVPVAPDQSLHDVVPFAREAVYPVSADRHVLGMLLLADVKAIPRERWRTTFVRDVMRPITTEQFVELGTPLIEAKTLLRTNNLGILAVIDADGRLVGVLRGTVRRP